MSKRQRQSGGEPEWDQKTAFPIIARAIERLYRRDIDKYISKREIVPLLLRERTSLALIKAAYKEKRPKVSIDKYAGIMVQWFSQRWTTSDEKWASLFKKFKRSEMRLAGCWAYKPISPSAVNVFPDEIEAEEAKRLPEGARVKRFINVFERKHLARQQCIEKYGSQSLEPTAPDWFSIY